MTNILEFPSQRAQGLAYLDELIDFAASTVRRVYERSVDAENYSFSVTLPEGISDADAEALRLSITRGVERIRDENHAVVIRLIAELVLAEVKIFQAHRE